MKLLLGIDYGRAHVGIAIARTTIAEPLEVISLDKATQEIKKLVVTEKIEALVVGVSEGVMAAESRAFGTKLANELGLKVFFQDETLTSQSATKNLRHASKKKRQGPDHHYAAALILQDYIDFSM